MDIDFLQPGAISLSEHKNGEEAFHFRIPINFINVNTGPKGLHNLMIETVRFDEEFTILEQPTIYEIAYKAGAPSRGPIIKKRPIFLDQYGTGNSNCLLDFWAKPNESIQEKEKVEIVLICTFDNLANIELKLTGELMIETSTFKPLKLRRVRSPLLTNIKPVTFFTVYRICNLLEPCPE